MKRLIGLSLALAMLASGCTKVSTSNASGYQPHWLRIADGAGDIPSLNPHLFQETTLGNIAALTMAYFAKYDANGNPVPELLTVIPTQQNGGIDKAGTTITWHLRHGVRWSDGAPFDADDVVFSTKAVLNPANNEVGRDGWNLITKIDEPDKYTVVYHLSKPYSSYLPAFFGSAGANPCVLPKHLLAQYPNINHVAYNAKPVGIGPFRVTAWRRGDAVEMEANPYYFRGEPKLKHITYKLISDRDTLFLQMQTGEVDLWPQNPTSLIDRLKSLPGVAVYVKPSSYYAHLDFNLTHPLVSDVRVREAIRYAINRKRLIDKVSHGYGILTEVPLSPILPIAPKDIPLIPYDPAKARALLDETGWKVGADGIRTKNGQKLVLEFPYVVGSPDLDQRVELMRGDLQAVGIGLQTRKEAASIFFGLLQDGGTVYAGKFDITLFSWGTGPGADISSIFSCDDIPPKGQNDVRYCNRSVVEPLITQYKATYDENVQHAIVEKEMKQLIADVPTIVLGVAKEGYAYSNRLTGYTPGAITNFDDMMKVDI